MNGTTAGRDLPFAKRVPSGNDGGGCWKQRESEASRYLEISGTKLDRPRNTRQIKSFTNELRSFYSHRVLRPVEAGPSKNESGGRRGRDLAPVRRAHTDPHITDLMIVNRGIIGLYRQSQRDDRQSADRREQ